MLCEYCHTEQSISAAEDKCPTCGLPMHSENELATRVTPSGAAGLANGAVNGGAVTGGEAGMTTGVPSRSGEADISTFGGEQARQSFNPGDVLPSAAAAPAWTSAMDGAGVDGAMCLIPGAILGGRYEIRHAIGEGGMGSVYKAHDREVNREVAIKIIRPELANDPAIVQRFKQELVLARQVTHRNVVRIYDLGVASGLRFISMEFIDGRELGDVLREKGKLAPKEAAEIMLQVCRGLEAAHAQGVIHRDLKPQNIMLDRRGRAAVMDFGIAHSAVGGESAEASTAQASSAYALTQYGSLLGTPRYMSPEQAAGGAVDARSDIYTVGLILYELLAGKLPFSALSVKELLKNKGKQLLAPLASVDRTVPKRLSEIVQRCLEREPGQRYPDVVKLVEELEVWLGIRSKAGAKGMQRWTVAASCVALLAVLAFTLLLRERITTNAAKAHRPVSLLITDFRNDTGQALLSNVAEPMLQVAMEGSSFITSYNRGRAKKIAASLQPGVGAMDARLGQLVALREGIGVVLGGKLERRGSDFQLSATATDANGKTIASNQASFNRPGDLPNAVDRVAAGLRRVLGDSGHASRNSAAETFTSGSLQSAQLYAQAQQLQWDGKWMQAVELWKQAATMDPKMSRAYAGIAATLANLGDRQGAIRYYQLALANIDRESEREKFRTRGGYYLLMRDYQKAAEQFGQLVKEYPVDSAGLANLALTNFYARNMTAALGQGRKAVEIYPQNILQRNNVGLYAMYAGDFDAAIKESQAILKLNPSFEKAYVCLGMSQLQSGQVEQAKKTYQAMAGLSDWGASESALALGDLAIYQGRYGEAIGILQSGISNDRVKKNNGAAGLKWIALAQAQLGRGQKEPARRSAAEAVRANEDESVLFSAGQVDLQAGDSSAAAAIAKTLDNKFESEPRALGEILQGEIELEAGRLHDAVSRFQDSQKLADTWLVRFDLGRLYLAAKQYPDAENEFDICLKRRGEATAVYLDDEPTVRYLPPVFYYLGAAKAGLGSGDALSDFKSFLATKQVSERDAMVSDARRRVKTQ